MEIDHLDVRREEERLKTQNCDLVGAIESPLASNQVAVLVIIVSKVRIDCGVD